MTGAINRLRPLERKPARGELVGLRAVVRNGLQQAVVLGKWQEVERKAVVPPDVGIGMRMLEQIAHDREKRRLIPVEARPRVEAHVGLAVFLPCRDREQHLRHARGALHVRDDLELARVFLPKVRRALLADTDFHILSPSQPRVIKVNVLLSDRLCSYWKSFQSKKVSCSGAWTRCSMIYRAMRPRAILAMVARQRSLPLR